MRINKKQTKHIIFSIKMTIKFHNIRFLFIYSNILVDKDNYILKFFISNYIKYLTT